MWFRQIKLRLFKVAPTISREGTLRFTPRVWPGGNGDRDGTSQRQRW